MVPKPKPLHHQGEVLVIGKNVVRIEPGESQVDVDDTGRLPLSSFPHETTKHIRPAVETDPSSSFGKQENETGVIRSPSTSREWGNDGTHQSRYCSIRANSQVVQSRSQQATSPSTLKRQNPDGIMIRRDDLLERTFDNVEVFICKDHSTRSPRRGPPPPVFSCADGRVDQPTAFSEVMDLSNAKRLGNAIEMNAGGEINLRTHTNGLGRINSVADERSSVPGLIGTRQQQTSTGTDEQMFRSLVNTANGILCRDPLMAVVRSPKADDINLAKEEDKTLPVNLQAVVGGDDKSKGGAKSFGFGFNTANNAFYRQRQISSMTSGGYPSQHEAAEASAMTKKRRAVPSAGTLLLPDGTMVSPTSYKAEEQRIQRQQDWPNLSCDPKSLLMSRTNSLLDVEIGLESGQATAPSSGEEDEVEEDDDDRLMQLRQKKRAIENMLSRRTDVATTHTVIIPRHHVSKVLPPTEREAGGSPISVEQIERRKYWKHVVLGVVLFLVLCAMIIFVVSFLWPTDR